MAPLKVWVLPAAEMAMDEKATRLSRISAVWQPPLPSPKYECVVGSCMNAVDNLLRGYAKLVAVRQWLGAKSSSVEARRLFEICGRFLLVVVGTPYGWNLYGLVVGALPNPM